jgi:serine/threonine protein kinase
MSEPSQIVFDKVDRMECQSCHAQIDVSSLPAFTQAICPSCGKEVTVPGRLGNYLLLNCLGSGGMGSVYRAYDETLARIVAIKVMLKSLGDAPEFLESFRREAQAAAKLNHPNIAQIYSFGQEKGQPYIVMELVGGKHFDEMIAQPEPLDQAMVMKIGMDIADGLQLAAASNLIHGDIKPENILLDERDTAKLLDFGIASSPNAQTTEIWGTPYYIAPEKLKRQRVDFRSDIYCLGATLYHALTQHPPFEGDDAIAVVKARLEHPPEPMKTYRPDIDPEVEEIIDRMLQVEPAMRYPTYGSLLSDMRRYLSRVQPQMPSVSTASNKRVIIKGRGKGAGSASVGSGGAPSGKHHISVSRGMVDPKTITASHTSFGTDGAESGHGKMLGAEDSDSGKGGSKAMKGCLIAFGVIVALLALAGGGFLYHLKSQNKKAMAEYAELVGKRDEVVSNFQKLRASAEKLRDETMPVYLGEAANIVSQAIAAVEAEVGTEFTQRIVFEAPEPEEVDEPPPEEAAEDEAADGEAKEGEAKEGEAKEGEAKDGEAAEDGDKKDEAKDEEKADEEKAEDKPAEEEAKTEDAAAETADGEAAAEEAAPEEPALEGIPLLAREVFEALAPVRKAGRQAMRVCDQVTMAAANAEANGQKIDKEATGKTAEIREKTDAAAGVIAGLSKELASATALYAEAQSATESLQGDIRKAKAKFKELLGETSKLTAERQRKAEEEAKAQRAREEEEARLAEQQRIAAEKQGQIGKVVQAAAMNLENLRAFKYDQVIRELKRLDNELTYPESKKALELAIKRVECLKELKAFLIERAEAIPFVAPNGQWSVKSATDRSLEIVFKNGKSDHVTWDKMTLKQMVPFISFYLDKEENVKTLKLRQHVDALRNAAIYYMTFAADNQGAQTTAKKYLAEAVEKLPSRAKEISELLPELKMSADGGL